jgi:tellurite resistance protein TerC
VLVVTAADLTLFVGLIVALFFFLWLDLHFFARGREPSFREAVIWSIGWLLLSFLAIVPVLLLEGSDKAVNYTTVYLIERTLSLDNLFVFLLLFAYFGVPYERRPRLLFWGIVAALVMRGLFILGGSALIEQFHFVIYPLGAALIVLAYRVFRGVQENVDPDRNFMVRLVRRFYPVTGEFHGAHWFVRRDGRRWATPLFLCLAAIVFADLAFAIDSIPAAFAITRDPLIIWMGNVFALLGLRALFVLVESLIARFRYLDETIAIVLGLVGVKLLVEDVVKVGPLASLAVIGVAFTIGIVASVIADRRDPDSERKRHERVEAVAESGNPPGPEPPPSADLDRHGVPPPRRAAASPTPSDSALARGAPAEQAGEPE